MKKGRFILKASPLYAWKIKVYTLDDNWFPNFFYEKCSLPRNMYTIDRISVC